MGIRTYAVDVVGSRGPVHRGPVDFAVGQQEVHAILIEVDEAGKVHAQVDEAQVEANVFPVLQGRIQKFVWV